MCRPLALRFLAVLVCSFVQSRLSNIFTNRLIVKSVITPTLYTMIGPTSKSFSRVSLLDEDRGSVILGTDIVRPSSANNGH